MLQCNMEGAKFTALDVLEGTSIDFSRRNRNPTLNYTAIPILSGTS